MENTGFDVPSSPGPVVEPAVRLKQPVTATTSSTSSSALSPSSHSSSLLTMPNNQKPPIFTASFEEKFGQRLKTMWVQTNLERNQKPSALNWEYCQPYGIIKCLEIATTIAFMIFVLPTCSLDHCFQQHEWLFRICLECLHVLISTLMYFIVRSYCANYYGGVKHLHGRWSVLLGVSWALAVLYIIESFVVLGINIRCGGKVHHFVRRVDTRQAHTLQQLHALHAI